MKYFASDLPATEAKLIAAGQDKLHKGTLDQRVSVAAWEVKPSWFIVSANDQMIAPGVMRLMARKIGAKTIELATSHVSMLSKPAEVAAVILNATKAN